MIILLHMCVHTEIETTNISVDQNVYEPNMLSVINNTQSIIVGSFMF